MFPKEVCTELSFENTQNGLRYLDLLGEDYLPSVKTIRTINDARYC